MSSELKRRILHGWSWAITCRIVGMSATMMLYALLARSLTPAELGGYFLLISIVGLLSTLTLFGMPQVAVRVVATSSSATDGGNARSAIYKTFGFVLITNLLAILLLNSDSGISIVESVLHLEADILKNLKIVGFLVFSTSMTILIAEYFRGLHDIRMASIFGGALASVLTVALFLVLGALGLASLENAILTALSASIMVLVTSVIVFSFSIKSVLVGNSISLKSLTYSAWPIAVLNISVLISTQGEIWVVNNKLSAENVATYGSVLRVVGLLVMTHSLLIAASQSSMAELYANKKLALLQTLGRTISTVSSIIGLFALIIFYIWGEDILSMIFGSFYADGFQLMMIMASLYVLGMCFGPSGMLLMMAGKMKLFVFAIIVSIFIRFITAYALLTHYGVNGVAVGWGVGGLIQSFCGWYLVKRELGIFCHIELFNKKIFG